MSVYPHGDQPVAKAGKPLAEADGVMILIHGRGASAPTILTLGEVLSHPGLHYVAPQASQHTWYPFSFLAPVERNQPGIDSGLAKIEALVAEAEAAGIAADKIVLAGFSQGACLASEYVARNPQRYGALFVFSGGVIGPLDRERQDVGDLAGTPVFIGCSDVDAHIPVERVNETAAIMTSLGGQVVKKIYEGMAHTIIQDEIDEANKILLEVFGENDA